MRLIDADARVTVQNFDPMNEEYSHTEMSVEQALDFATDEGCPPTVDAIPMWWITEKFLDVMNKDKELSKAVWLVRKAWLQEQEAR